MVPLHNINNLYSVMKTETQFMLLLLNAQNNTSVLYHSKYIDLFYVLDIIMGNLKTSFTCSILPRNQD